MTRRVAGLAAGLVAGLALAAGLAAQAAPVPGVAQVSFARRFPGSVPEFEQVVVGEDGAAVVTIEEHAGDGNQQVRFAASAAGVEKIFQAAGALHEFQKPTLQAKARVAFLGDKRLVWSGGGRRFAQRYTYTTVPAAAALERRMERIATAAEDVVRLRRALRYDRLGALAAVRQARRDWRQHRLAEAQMLLPVLKRAAAAAGLMQAAQREAAALAAGIAAGRLH